MPTKHNVKVTDFNLFAAKVDDTLKAKGIKLTATEKNSILNAVSWYDAEAEKVVKGTIKLTGDKLDKLLHHLDCTAAQLPHYGYYPTSKKGEYETAIDLRDTENVPLKEAIFDYYLREVYPHLPEAWINIDSAKIGYEISSNKYFYLHKPLRSIEEVTADIEAIAVWLKVASSPSV